MATSDSTSIIKFADDTVVVCLIADNEEKAYLEETIHQENNLSVNISKTKELKVDFGKKQKRNYHPLRINGPPVERVNSFRYLGVCITEDLSWSFHVDITSDA